MAASVTTFIPVEEFLRTPEWENAEYLDGVVEEKNMGTWDHSAWTLAISLWFARHDAEWKIRVKPELRIQISATRYLQPDVSILRDDAPVEQYPSTPPLAVFEIWSPGDKLGRTIRKLRLYEVRGVPHIWVADPEDGVWQRFVDGRLVDETVFQFPDRGIDFAMNEINKLVR